MKKILFILVILFSFLSCQKGEKFHKISYEIKMLEIPSNGNSNFIDVTAKPCDDENIPKINRFNVPLIWKYDYYGLKKGDEIMFFVDGQLSYRYEMRVYIDDVEVSYLKIKTSDYNYYVTYTEERSGLNDWRNTESSFINFVFQ
jgi:hypothetical protein